MASRESWHYYEVLVASRQITDIDLTYRSPAKIQPYRIVEVRLRDKTVNGLIIRQVARPEFDCLEIDRVTDFSLPEPLVRAGLDLVKLSGLKRSQIGQLILTNNRWRTPGKPIAINSASKKTKTPAPAPNPDQRKIIKEISRQEPGMSQLLAGIAGSGKTLVYYELIKAARRKGLSSLVLVPEIVLSAQVLQLLQSYGMDWPVYHYHSKLTVKERLSIRLEIATSDQPVLVLGTRSAEFLPIRKLGLVVLDEFHDDSFKQETEPNYHSLHMVSKLAKYHQARLVCGSATPRVEDYERFLSSGYPIHFLTTKALRGRAAEVSLVRREKGLLTDAALTEIVKSLAFGYQVLIFYNRRGSWRFATCEECGWQAGCLKCQNNLVFHQDDFQLKCHQCGWNSRPVSSCPDCRAAVVYSVPGIKVLENELAKKLGPTKLTVEIFRFDTDNNRQNRLGHKLAEIQSRPASILVGTQIISKGLDLPLLQTVVIVDAEQNLVTPDYRIQERYFQIIYQLIGRVGRGHVDQTKVVIQTSNPDNPTLQAACQEDWLQFYNQEIDRRQRYNLPPFSYIAKILIRRKTRLSAQKTAYRLLRDLQDEFPGINFYGPTPSLHEKKPSYHEWLIHAFAKDRSRLVGLSNHLRGKAYLVKLDPVELF